MTFVVTNDWTENINVKVDKDTIPPSASTFKVSLPVITNKTKLPPDTELILDWFIKLKKKRHP